MKLQVEQNQHFFRLKAIIGVESENWNRICPNMRKLFMSIPLKLSKVRNMPKELELPNAPMARLMKAAGAERVSDEACVALSEVLENYALKISQEATVLAKHAGRKTIKREDIALAVQRISK